jgi:hypothetical protein
MRPGVLSNNSSSSDPPPILLTSILVASVVLLKITGSSACAVYSNDKEGIDPLTADCFGGNDDLYSVVTAGDSIPHRAGITEATGNCFNAA